jgi:hypothetical protein
MGHCNRAAVSRNRYGVEKIVDTHKILINAINYQKGDGVQNNISLCFLHNVPLYGVLMGHKTLFGNRV